MKKFVYVILLSLASSLALTACTENDVEPINNADKPFGAPSDPGR